MFGFTGDPNPRHDVAGLPLLGVPLTILALLGARRAWNQRRDDPGSSLLLIGLAVFMVPPLVAVEGGSPHFLRSLGLAPILAGLIGLGSLELAGLAGALAGWARAPVVAACAAILVALGAGSWAAYSSRPVSDRYYAYSFDVVALAQAGAAAGNAVVVEPYPALTVRFIDHDRLPLFLDPRSDRGLPPSAMTMTRVVARSRSELAAVVGSTAAATAVPVAWDYRGRAVAWAVNVSR
jgi:hypothetical protein